MSDLWSKITIYVASGAASTSIKDLKNIVEQTKTAMKVAEGTSNFLGIFPNAGIRFAEIAEKLDDVSKSLGKIEKTITAGVQIWNIYHAIKILKDNRIFIEDPQKAADAFDALFKGFGWLCGYLPPPANQWGDAFSNFSLFGNIQRNILNPYHKRFEDIHKAGQGKYN